MSRCEWDCEKTRFLARRSLANVHLPWSFPSARTTFVTCTNCNNKVSGQSSSSPLAVFLQHADQFALASLPLSGTSRSVEVLLSGSAPLAFSPTAALK